MATRNPQTQAKRARELAVRDRRDRKRAKKAEAAARRAAAAEPAAGEGAAPTSAQTEEERANVTVEDGAAAGAEIAAAWEPDPDKEA